MSKIDVDQTVRDLEAGKTPQWIAEHLRIYRESGGAEGHLFDSTVGGGVGLVTSLLLTTVGRRSGEKRTSPLFYDTAGDAYIIIGSKGGADTQPNWYLNLRANPKRKCKSRASTLPPVHVLRQEKSANSSGSRWCSCIRPIESIRRKQNVRSPWLCWRSSQPRSRACCTREEEAESG
jgi:deazaflavin-dependent oxidoreductase (nitroreductase family)